MRSARMKKKKKGILNRQSKLTGGKANYSDVSGAEEKGGRKFGTEKT